MKPESKTKQITIKITPTMWNDLEEKSDDLGGIGVSNVVRIAITEYLKEERI
jgi:metal-responsive CopG/Arc/MetJ family transcriptional regulator